MCQSVHHCFFPNSLKLLLKIAKKTEFRKEGMFKAYFLVMKWNYILSMSMQLWQIPSFPSFVTCVFLWFGSWIYLLYLSAYYEIDFFFTLYILFNGKCQHFLLDLSLLCETFDCDSSLSLKRHTKNMQKIVE